MAKVTRGPSLYSAMRARMGGENYFILTMAAWDLARRCGWPQKIEGWDENLSIEERYQRDINYNRVRKQIAPYLANDDSRFFGAVIVAAMNFGEEVSFEPLAEMTTKGLPGLYRKASTNMGFLTFEGGELLVPLDGQHRLKAIEFAVTGRDERGRDIAGIIKPCTQLAQEDVTVILVPYIPQRARKIFTRVNRYARPTTTGQNIVTDDDDILAVLTREVANDLIGGRLAKYSSNTLTTKDPEFTTLAIVYNCNEAIITNSFPGGKLDTTQLPEVPKIKLYRNKVREVWQVLLENIEVFADALSDKEETGDEKRREIRDTNLLGKPVVQECLVRAFIRLTGDPSNMGSEKACEKLNALPWNITEANLEIWQGILWAGGVDGKIITKNRKLTTDMIAYLAGEKITDDGKVELLEKYLGLFPEAERAGKELPQLSQP